MFSILPAYPKLKPHIILSNPGHKFTLIRRLRSTLDCTIDKKI